MISIKKYLLSLLLSCICMEHLSAQNETQRNIDSLNNVLNRTKKDTTKVNTLCVLSWYLGVAGERQKARESAEKAYRLADKINFKSGKAEALNMVANSDWVEENLQGALDKYKLCAKMNEEIGNKLGLGHNLNNIGNIKYVKTEYPEAIKYYKLALKSYEALGSSRWICNTYNNLGSVFQQLGNSPEALKYLITGLKIANESGNKDMTPIMYLNIGDIYMDMENYPEALKSYKTYMASARELGAKGGIVGAHRAMGRLYEKTGRYDEALANFLIAYKGEMEIGLKRPSIPLLKEIGKAYFHQARYTEALKSYDTAIKISHENGAVFNLPELYINVGETYSKLAGLESKQELKSGKYNEAIRSVNMGLDLAKKAGEKKSIKEGYRVLSQVYKGLNDYKKALEYNGLYVTIKDSLLNSETNRKLEQQRTQYEVERSTEEEKIKSTAALTEQKARLKRKNELVFGGLAIIAIISILIALLIRERSYKRRAVDKAEAGHKMAELELQSLRAQLNPHFMFNSLNAIQDLILKEDNDRSQLYLSRFSKLLRILLDNANQPFVSIKQELEFLDLYLSLENLRIPDLQFSIEKDPNINTEERMVPNMMLQPYIENAIWHGLSHKKENRKLQIRIHETENATEFEIEDNGVGRQKAEELKSLYRKGHHSKGMELLSKRFNLLSKEYGEAIHTSVTDLVNNGDATGTLVKIDVPFSLSSQAKQLTDDTNHHN